MSNQEFENVFAEDRKRKVMYAAVGVTLLIALTAFGVYFGTMAATAG